MQKDFYTLFFFIFLFACNSLHNIEIAVCKKTFVTLFFSFLFCLHTILCIILQPQYFSSRSSRSPCVMNKTQSFQKLTAWASVTNETHAFQKINCLVTVHILSSSFFFLTKRTKPNLFKMIRDVDLWKTECVIFWVIYSCSAIENSPPPSPNLFFRSCFQMCLPGERRNEYN